MYQKLTIVGNLGRDPELRYTPAGSPVTNFDVATNWKRKDDDDVTTWFRISVWGSQAEACNQYLSKGSLVLVEGTLQCDHATGGPRLYQRTDGSWGSSFEMTASVVKFLGGKQEQEQAEPEQEELPF